MAKPPASSSRRDTVDDLRQLLAGRPFAAGAWLMLLAPDCHLRIGNMTPAVGRTRAIEQLGVFLGCTVGVGGAFWDKLGQERVLLIETDVQIQGDAGRLDDIPCAIILRPPLAPFQDIRIYLDPGPSSPIRARLR
jgi:hypothetical protein